MADSMAREARSASRECQALGAEARTRALTAIAAALEANKASLLAENAKDLEAAKSMDIPPATLQRLKLKEGKIAQLAKGIRSLAASTDPVGRVLSRMQVAEGLSLDRGGGGVELSRSYVLGSSRALVSSWGALVSTDYSPLATTSTTCRVHGPIMAAF